VIGFGEYLTTGLAVNLVDEFGDLDLVGALAIGRDAKALCS
jgi:hypothetical protein